MSYAVAIVDQIESDQLSLPTPCAGWDLGQLLAHMIGQNHGFASAARGEAYDPAAWADRPVTDAPGPAFAASADEVVAAFAEEAATQRDWPFQVGTDRAIPVPGSRAMGFHFIDYVVHAWDVAVSIGVQPRFDADVLAAVLPLAEEVPLDGPSRSGPDAPFAPAIDIKPDEGLLERVLAILGRDPQWTPEAS